MSLLEFPVELAETNRLLARIADALERLAPPAPTDAGPPRKPRGREAVGQVTNESMVKLELERERWQRDPWQVTPFEPDNETTADRKSEPNTTTMAESRSEPEAGKIAETVSEPTEKTIA